MGHDIKLNDDLLEYIINSIPPEPEILKELRKETEKLGNVSVMQISWLQARFMQLLAKISNTKTYLELGTFTGYSALAMALSIPSEGKVITLDKDKNWTDIAVSYWEKANVKNKIENHLDDAQSSLRNLLIKGYENSIDMMFIDADKRALSQYLDFGHKLVKIGGLIIIDNVLWQGNIINPNDDRKNTKAIVEFNKTLKNDPRFEVSMIPVGDGITLAYKK